MGISNSSCLTRTVRLEKTLIQTVSCQLSSTLMQLLFRIWPEHESWELSHTNSRLSTLLINSHATLVLVWPGHESWENFHTNSRLSTLINSQYNSFSFDKDMRVEKSLIQTLAYQLSSSTLNTTLLLVWPGHESWENFHTNSRLSTLINSQYNSFSRLTRTWELRNLSYKLSLINSPHQLSCNSCSRLTRTWELRKLSYKLSLVNCNQLS